MARFLIEVPHDDSLAACLSAVDVFLRSGSHFLSRADWGCRDSFTLAEIEHMMRAQGH